MSSEAPRGGEPARPRIKHRLDLHEQVVVASAKREGRTAITDYTRPAVRRLLAREIVERESPGFVALCEPSAWDKWGESLS